MNLSNFFASDLFNDVIASQFSTQTLNGLVPINTNIYLMYK